MRMRSYLFTLKFFVAFILFALPLFLLRAQVGRQAISEQLRKPLCDSARISLLNSLAWELKYDNTDSAILLARQALTLAKANHSPFLAHVTCNKLGVFYSVKGSTGEALDYHMEALTLLKECAEKISLKALKRFYAQSCGNLALVYQEMGFLPKALQLHLLALRIDEQQQSKNEVVRHYGNVGNIFAIQGDYTQALGYFKKALQLARVLNNRELEATWLSNIGNVYKDLGNTKEAYHYYLKALETDKALNNKNGIARNLGGIGNVLEAQGRNDSAMMCYRKAVDLFRKAGSIVDVAIIYNSMAAIYDKTGKPADGETYYKKSMKLSEEAGDLYGMMETNGLISELYSRGERHVEALRHYRAHIAYRDSLFNEENTKKTVQAQMNYEFDKKDAAVKLGQEKKEVIAAAERRRQRIILLAISGFGLLVLGFAIFAYRSFLQKKKANIEINRQKSIIEEKQKEILDSIYYARRIQQSLLPTEKYVARHLKHLMKSH